MTERPKIIVLTPVKNEAWILPRFLATTSQWADRIIIADQYSTDESLEICRRFDKVMVIQNENPNYDEAQRQVLLIKTAREQVPGPCVLMALDADEILAADAPAQPGWSKMLAARSGTVLFFEKPDLCRLSESDSECIRFDEHFWPLGFVDDGSTHQASIIHSTRVPCPPSASTLRINDVKVLHYNLLRKRAHESKRRMYGVIECLSGNMPWRRRIVNYKANIDWTKQGPLQPCPHSWFEGWEAKGINMRTIEDAEFNWYDLAVLKHMQLHGERRFYWEDIWHFDWEACRNWALNQNKTEVPELAICGPGPVPRFILRMTQNLILGVRGTLRKLKAVGNP